MALKIVFFGTPDAARIVLESLYKSDHEIAGVLTQPDKRRSRGNTLSPTPVKEFAVENGLEVYTPETKSEIEKVVSQLEADIGVVVAYGKILTQSVLDAFEYGCINIHYSLLPRWRGAAPIERSILAGDEVTGVSIMQLTQGLDEGPIYAARQIDLKPNSTTKSVYESMNSIADELLLMVLDSIKDQKPYEQEGEVTYANKLSANDFYFDKETSVIEIDRKVRAGSYVKGAHTRVNGETFRIISAENMVQQNQSEYGYIDQDAKLYCKDGYISIVDIQTPNKPIMKFADWVNGVGKENFPISFGNDE